MNSLLVNEYHIKLLDLAQFIRHTPVYPDSKTLMTELELVNKDYVERLVREMPAVTEILFQNKGIEEKYYHQYNGSWKTMDQVGGCPKSEALQRGINAVMRHESD